MGLDRPIEKQLWTCRISWLLWLFSLWGLPWSKCRVLVLTQFWVNVNIHYIFKALSINSHLNGWKCLLTVTYVFWLGIYLIPSLYTLVFILLTTRPYCHLEIVCPSGSHLNCLNDVTLLMLWFSMLDAYYDPFFRDLFEFKHPHVFSLLDLPNSVHYAISWWYYKNTINKSGDAFQTLKEERNV